MAVKIADVIKQTVHELRPEKVDLSAVTVTGEGDGVEIVLVPHRDLGGVSLVLWTDDRGTQLSWATVRNLSTHDEIDLGLLVSLIPHEGNWPAHLRDAIAEEVGRPIRLRLRRGAIRGGRVDCYVTVGGKERRLAVLRTRSIDGPMAELTTSLASGPDLPFSVPPPLENWRRNA